MLGYAKTIVLTSGTSETLPVDFNPGNNVVACLGAGAASFGSSYGSTNNYGGGGAAYAAKFNVPLLPNSICRYSLTTGSAGGKDQFRGIDTAFFGTIAGLSLPHDIRLTQLSHLEWIHSQWSKKQQPREPGKDQRSTSEA